LGPHTILKIDHWQKRQDNELAINFRKTDQFGIFGVAQPTLSAVSLVVDKTLTASKGNLKVVWINLREEPVIYIHGEPYVLRDQYATLRNIQAFSGISTDRLELMEFRLKEDVIAEAHYYNNKQVMI
jgi:hypothetical protein